MAERSVQLPFLAEYAKSSRSSCRTCRNCISKDSLRMACMVQSPHFDGMQPNWYHYACFWKIKSRNVTSTDDIGQFDALRWDDQEKIRDKIEGETATCKAEAGTCAKDFGIEYAKSNRSTCTACRKKIDKDAMRISHKSAQAAAEKGLPGTLPMWYHAECFCDPSNLKLVEWEDSYSCEDIGGFKELEADDQALLKQLLPRTEPKLEETPTASKKAASKKAASKDTLSSVDEPDVKKPKLDTKEDAYKAKLKVQSEHVWKIRDSLRSSVPLESMRELLEANGQVVPVGESKILDRVSDIMIFGPTEPCSECSHGQINLTTGGYACQGNISSWTKCTVFTQEPKRKKILIIPDTCTEDYMKDFVFKPFNGGLRIFPQKTSLQDQNENIPLRNIEVASAGKLSVLAVDIKKRIQEHGGTYTTNVTASTAFVISTKGEIKKASARIVNAKKHDVTVVSVEILEDIKKGGDIVKMIQQHSIAPWGSVDQLKARVGSTTTADMPSTSSATKSMAYPKQYVSSRKSGKTVSSGIKKVQIKGGGSVDPESGLDDEAHVLKEKGMLFSATLGMVDVTRGSNSYYKLQLLESDIGSGYWVFRSWGRVGTDIGGSKTQSFKSNKTSARRNFTDVYYEKTGNYFNTKNFQKHANKFYPMDIDYGEDEVDNLNPAANEESKLHPQLQNLMKLIYDINTLKQTMVEFEIDLDRMPLGKLSRAQLQSAYSVLTELQALIEAGNVSKNSMLDASNRFYTLIPHNFGRSIDIPFLDTLEVVQQKTKMVDSLLEIEVAYSLLKSTDKQGTQSPLDVNYEKLKCPMEVVPMASKEFKMIVNYTKNTHAATHSNYSLKVLEVFRLDRSGEADLFKPFSSLHNRMLLWHGSRLSNYCGILSQGLRIAPPEAPSTGYMFGKGVYFADMVSKSANYTYTSRTNRTGLMLLCEVAIGDSHELTGSSYITELPQGKHSTKGLGRTAPNPQQTITLDNGAIVPTGKGMPSKIQSSSLLYNEFIVYDVAQIRMKYLIKMDFKY